MVGIGGGQDAVSNGVTMVAVSNGVTMVAVSNGVTMVTNAYRTIPVASHGGLMVLQRECYSYFS
jgi:hypothetical protein